MRIARLVMHFFIRGDLLEANLGFIETRSRRTLLDREGPVLDPDRVADAVEVVAILVFARRNKDFDRELKEQEMHGKTTRRSRYQDPQKFQHPCRWLSAGPSLDWITCAGRCVGLRWLSRRCPAASLRPDAGHRSR